jgi:hypothetical protein
MVHLEAPKGFHSAGQIGMSMLVEDHGFERWKGKVFPLRPGEQRPIAESFSRRSPHPRLARNSFRFHASLPKVTFEAK